MSEFMVVWTDGYNREMVADVIVEENLSFVAATERCDALRAASRDEADWWIVRPKGAPLCIGMKGCI